MVKGHLLYRPELRTHELEPVWQQTSLLKVPGTGMGNGQSGGHRTPISTPREGGAFYDHTPTRGRHFLPPPAPGTPLGPTFSEIPLPG